MSIKKLLFYTLNRNNYVAQGGHAEPAFVVKNILEHIISLPAIERQYDLYNNKFCRVESLDEQNSMLKVVFLSATHRYRAPLIDKQSGNQRDNPKLISEGERVKTHLIFNIKQNEVLLVLEQGVGTVKIQQVLNYLNQFASLYHISVDEQRSYSLTFDIIAKDNFLVELNRLTRVIEGELFVDKQILGSDALNYSERIEPVKHDVKLTIKAERGRSINNALTDAFNKLNGGRSLIHKIRVRGKNDQDNDVLIDTDIISKVEYVETQVNQLTGEVNSDHIFEEMRVVAFNL